MTLTISGTLVENPLGYGCDYYTRNRAKGLDLLSFGEWQVRYGRWLVGVLGLRGKRVLDIGCACGSMLRGLWQAGADIDGIDCGEFLIKLGREQWPEMGGRLRVCDAVNLHSVADDTYDWLHSCVVAEHWKPQLVPHILAELRRVVKPGGNFYCAYESDGGAMADGRDPAAEPTHICVRPAAWWEGALREAGWQVASTEWARPLHEDALSFFHEYDWAWFVARKPP
jgi:SAM-dependent methyltransferase